MLRWLALFAGLVSLTSSSLASQLPANMENITLKVIKSKRRLVVFSNNKRIKSYRVGLGTDPITPKAKAGDRATPEGAYRICRKNPQSQYGLALVVNYPELHDAERGVRDKLIDANEKLRIETALNQNQCPPFNTKLGGSIEVHGHGSSKDWTWGCVALENNDMAELYAEVPVGTPIVIQP